MAYHVPYARKTFTPLTPDMPGNADNPVQFDLQPAWGADLARIKSIVFATTGLTQGDDWSPAIQDAVIKAFETGAPAFVNTISAIRGLTVPALMALRAGVIQRMPNRAKDGGGIEPDHDAPIPIETGRQFAMVCGAVLALALMVAMEIAQLSDKADADPRFFVQPSGSGAAAMPAKGKGGNATTARSGSRRRATAGRRSTTGAGQPTGSAADSTTGT